MAQIRKGFIAANAIDGTKLKLLNNDAIRAANADGTDAELMKLDSSNVLQFLKMPQVSSDPSAANDLARKSYVDGQVSSATSDLQDAVDAEQAAREAADAGLQSAIDTEVSDRQAAVSAEATTRASADSALQSAIDTEKGRIDAILSAATADADSFAEIVSLINSVDTTNDQAFASYVLSNDAALAQEVSDRQNGDSALQSAIDAEASARASAISSEASTRQSAISSEASTRQSADQTLQSNLDSEAATRASADTALGNRISALTADDLTDVQTSNKAAGDLMEWDATAGQWKNVAPISEGGSITTGTPAVESQLVGEGNGGFSNGGIFGPGQTFFLPGWAGGSWYYEIWSKFNSGSSSDKLKKMSYKLARLAPNNGEYVFSTPPANTGTVKLILNASRTSLSSPIATSSEVNVQDIPLSTQDWVDFSFESSNISLTPGTDYYVHMIFSDPTTVALTGKFFGNTSGVTGGWVTYSNGNIGDYSGVAARVYTMSGSGVTTTTKTGVIKTNAQGQLDDSFLAHDVDFGGHKLSGVSGPASDTDAANKKYVDDQVAAEASARSSAVSSEASARAAAVSQEASDRAAADTALQNSLDAEAANRQSADQNLQSQIDALDSGSSAGLAQEISDRQAADAVLQGNIDTEKARIDAILLASDADKDSFKEIVDLINSVDTENDNAFAAYVLSNNAALAQEVSDRQAADSAEQSAREAAVSSEASARAAADGVLQDNIDAEASARQAAVSQEVSDRQAADTALAGDLAAETTARQAAVTDLVNDLADEAAARASADTALQGSIDSEAAARAAADSSEQTAREAADAAEQAAREAADSALDARVDALEGVQHRKEKFTLSSTDISNGYVDLSMECVANSEMVFVGALYLHSGDHYTVSTVGGVTRLTWANDMVVSGMSELVAGDVVYVRYMK